jgi:hypothetical protein
MLLFSLGAVGTAVTALRLWKCVVLFRIYGRDSNTPRWLVEVTHLVLLSQVEFSIIIVCANLPGLAALFKRSIAARSGGGRDGIGGEVGGGGGGVGGGVGADSIGGGFSGMSGSGWGWGSGPRTLKCGLGCGFPSIGKSSSGGGGGGGGTRSGGADEDGGGGCGSGGGSSGNGGLGGDRGGRRRRRRGGHGRVRHLRWWKRWGGRRLSGLTGDGDAGGRGAATAGSRDSYSFRLKELVRAPECSFTRSAQDATTVCDNESVENFVLVVEDEAAAAARRAEAAAQQQLQQQRPPREQQREWPARPCSLQQHLQQFQEQLRQQKQQAQQQAQQQQQRQQQQQQVQVERQPERWPDLPAGQIVQSTTIVINREFHGKLEDVAEEEEEDEAEEQEVMEQRKPAVSIREA